MIHTWEVSTFSRVFAERIQCCFLGLLSANGAMTGFFPCEGTGLVTSPFKESPIPSSHAFTLPSTQLDVALIE